MWRPCLKLLEVGLAILACYRLSQLFALDQGPYDVFDRLRRFCGKRGVDSLFWASVAEGLHCPYCLGVWWAMPLAILVGGNFILCWLGIAGGQAFLEALSSDRSRGMG